MTHPRLHAAVAPDRAAVVMSDGSPGLTYGELEARANRGAHLFRSLGITRGQTIAFWLPNCPEVFEIYWAAQRAGLYITPIATNLTASEGQYIITNSGARLLVACPDTVALAGLDHSACGSAEVIALEQWRSAIATQDDTPINDESPGFHMVYSSGTTGRPKGIRLPLPEGGGH
jgi:long-chain acyl-CoA synthetase